MRIGIRLGPVYITSSGKRHPGSGKILLVTAVLAILVGVIYQLAVNLL